MLIDVSDVKRFLGITVTTDDDLLMPLCQSAQDMADGMVGFPLEGSTFTDIMDCDGLDIIQLRVVPVQSVTSLYVDWDRTYGADTLIASTDYALNGDTGVITAIGCNFVKGANAIKVTYVAGYGAGYTALPYDLRQALIYLASAQYIEGKAGVNVFESQEIVYRPSYLKTEAKKILDGYRKILV